VVFLPHAELSTGKTNNSDKKPDALTSSPHQLFLRFFALIIKYSAATTISTRTASPMV